MFTFPRVLYPSPYTKKNIYIYIDEWIIVYDGNKIESKPSIFEQNEKIKECIHKCDCISGNGQKSYALTKITNPDTLLCYLDDDNIIHPDLYNLLDFTDNNTIYTFNQYNRIKGNNIHVDYIDTAMVIIPLNLCKNIKWNLYFFTIKNVFKEIIYFFIKMYILIIHIDLFLFIFISLINLSMTSRFLHINSSALSQGKFSINSILQLM